MSVHEHENNVLLIDDEQEQVNDQGDLEVNLDCLIEDANIDMAVMLGRFSRSLKEMECTVEAAAIPGVLTDKQKASITTRVKAMVSKLLDYHIVRSTEDIMNVYQSIVKIRATSVKLCINGGGKLTFPSAVNLPSVTAMRLDYLSGEVSGRLPDTLQTLWVDGVMRFSKMAPLTLNGLSNLQVLCVTSCHVLKNLLQTWEKGTCLRVIMTLCRIHKCQCEALIKNSPLIDLPYKVIIVPHSRYNVKTLTENAAIQKNAYHYRVGMVFYKNLGSLKRFAKCELPADIGELYSERKKIREENATEAAF
uniref:F-box domain-containing protein n=1 Tax=Strongyloides papillosus TaxID=174720 RepID=A0A0N5C7X3_STREA